MNNFEFQKLMNAKQENQEESEKIEELTSAPDDRNYRKEQQQEESKDQEAGFKARGNTAEMTEETD